MDEMRDLEASCRQVEIHIGEVYDSTGNPIAGFRATAEWYIGESEWRRVSVMGGRINTPSDLADLLRRLSDEIAKDVA